jgi:hypothetical protein
MSNILGGIVVGLVSGGVVGLLTIVSDAVFYKKRKRAKCSEAIFKSSLPAWCIFGNKPFLRSCSRNCFYMGGADLTY